MIKGIAVGTIKIRRPTIISCSNSLELPFISFTSPLSIGLIKVTMPRPTIIRGTTIITTDKRFLNKYRTFRVPGFSHMLKKIVVYHYYHLI
jgi:hypothetical protein